MLAKNPSFTVLTIAALALGIGGTTAIFTVVNSVLLRPLVFKDPDRLVMVREITPGGTLAPVIQTQNFLDWQSRNRSFESIAAVHQIPMNLAGTNDPEQVMSLRVSGDFFRVLGVSPLLGRPFSPEDDQPGAPDVAILSYGLWKRRFGGDPNILQKRIARDASTTLQVAGVMPPGFSFRNIGAEMYVPLRIDPARAPRDGRNYLAVARLLPGVSLAQAAEDMRAIAASTARERPDMNAKWSATVTPLDQETTGSVKLLLSVLFGGVCFVLLIACANVANLLLMRAASREREMTVRMAIGASRWHLVQQTIVESLLLTGIGGAAGLALAHWGVRAMIAMLPAGFPLPRMEEIGMDGAVLAFTAAVSLGVGIVFGLMPAIRFGRTTLAGSLHAGGRSVAGGQRRLRGALVTLEVALALLLVIGAGLMVRSFIKLYRVDPGFESERLLTLRMVLLVSKYAEPPRRAAVVEEILHRDRSLPQVTAASSIHILPLLGNSGTPYYRTDRPVPPPGESPGGDVSVVSTDYFRTMRISVISGRDFAARDRAGTPQTAILNQSAARMLFGGEDPIGKRLNVWWGQQPEVEIVGVVADIRHSGLQHRPEPCLFLPNAQQPNLRASLVVRTSGDPMALARSVRDQIRAVDPDQGVSDVMTMDELLSESMARPKLQTVLLAAFGSVALILACVGIYGIVSYSVEQRTREIGVRVALGAKPAQILRIVFREGLGLAAAGIVLGSCAALALTRYLSTLLYEVTPTDPSVFAAVIVVLITVASAACWFPAIRATRVDPAVVLREE
jgi:putative ABC transport system permease protein